MLPVLAALSRFLCFGSFLVLPAVSAQTSSVPSILPPNNFQFTGNWTCEGNFRNSKIHKAAFTGATILSNRWLELTERDLEPATGYLAKYLIGYDPHTKQFVEFDANTFGAATYTSTPGWQENVLTMTSPVSHDSQAPYAANRFLYTVTAQDTFIVDWQISRTASAAWTTADHLTCKRQ